MTSRLDSVAFDATDPLKLARFWAGGLRWDIDDEDPGVIEIVPTDGTGFGIIFLRAPNEKTGPNRTHLELTTTSLEDQRETVETLLELGGRHLDIGQGPDAEHVVLADPEGNELCIIEPTNNFLAGCPRLGNINGDGTQAVGYFWSAALGWPLVWDQDEETAIQAPDGTGPKMAWGGPPIPPKHSKNRIHLDLAPTDGDKQAEVERLIGLGAARTDIGQGDVAWEVMVDPDGNEFCVLDHK